MFKQKQQVSSSDELGVKAAAEVLIGQLSASSSVEKSQIALLENHVLATLSHLKTALINFNQSPKKDPHQQICQQYDGRLQQLAVTHRERKKRRDCDRVSCRQQLQGDSLTAALADLAKASQKDSTERRRLKQERARAIAPFSATIAETDTLIQTLKYQYTTLSRQWQAQMQLAYSVPETVLPFHIIYQDACLLVIDKPAGLLSVPGRRMHLQDSVLSRLRHQLPEQAFLQPVHRLDQATSGVLAIALSPSAHRALSQQFAQQQVHKTYEAILSKPVSHREGTIDLPLSSHPDNRPKQLVNFQQGKPSRTDFKVLIPGQYPRVEFTPHTGRTHQLRVHAAHPQGLNAPILGDTIYDQEKNKEKRLYLHAASLHCLNTKTKESQVFSSHPPF